MPGQDNGHADRRTGGITFKDIQKAVKMLKKYKAGPPFRLRLPVPGGTKDYIVYDPEYAAKQAYDEWMADKEKAAQS